MKTKLFLIAVLLLGSPGLVAAAFSKLNLGISTSKFGTISVVGDTTQPPLEPSRPPTPSLSVYAQRGVSDIGLDVVFTCAQGFNTLYKLDGSGSLLQTVAVEPCDKQSFVDKNVIPNTEYCYKLESISSSGIRNSKESCAKTNFDRVGFTNLVITPADTASVLNEFSWYDTNPVEEETWGHPEEPYLYYMNVFIESEDAVQNMRKMGVHMQETPVFLEELGGWKNSQAFIKENDTLIGRWYYAIVPGITFNALRVASIAALDEGYDAPYRAVVFRKIPVIAGQRSSLDVHNLSYSFIAGRGLEFNGIRQYCEVLNGVTICAKQQELVGWLIRKFLVYADKGWTYVADRIHEGIGLYKRRVNGEVSLTLQFHLMNTDALFDVNSTMQSGWRNEEILLKDVNVHIRQGLATFYGKTDNAGRTTIMVAKNEKTQVCLQAENNYIKLTEFIGRTIVCVDTLTPINSSQTIDIDAVHPYLNLLGQMTDSADYMKTVVKYDMKKITVLVGEMADAVALMDRAFTPCMGRDPSLIGAFTDLLGFLHPAALAFSAFAEFTYSIDIVLPKNVENARGVGVHEYGHATMCDMLARQSLVAKQLVWTEVIFASADQTGNNETSYIVEAFADYLTSQIVGGTNYFILADTVSSDNVSYCQAGFDCLDANLNESDSANVSGDFVFHAQIQRVASILHDAFDGHGLLGQPNDGSQWQYLPLPDNLLIPLVMNDSDLDDEGIALPGSSLIDLFRHWVDNGHEASESGFLGGLVDTMVQYGYSRNEVCNMFSMHSQNGQCPAYVGRYPIQPKNSSPEVRSTGSETDSSNQSISSSRSTLLK